jgi:hypothetical protein
MEASCEPPQEENGTGTSEAHELTLPIAPFPSGMKTALQRVPGNVHPCAISKLPHGKQANFAHTPAVCLISDFYSEQEEKILSLDLV